MGRKQAGLATQLSRIRRGLFPSAAQIYQHLRVGAPRLPSGPEAALVGGQLEAALHRARPSTSQAGRAGPKRRLRAKTPDMPVIPPPKAARTLLLAVHGLTEESLRAMAAEASASRRGLAEPNASDGAFHHGSGDEDADWWR